MKEKTEFRTKRLPLASWLHANAQLEFLGCVYNNRMNKVEFCFEDPDRVGHDLENDFDEGPALLFSSMHFLRKQMSAAENAARDAQTQSPNGEYRDYTRRSY